MFCWTSERKRERATTGYSMSSKPQNKSVLLFVFIANFERYVSFSYSDFIFIFPLAFLHIRFGHFRLEIFKHFYSFRSWFLVNSFWFLCFRHAAACFLWYTRNPNYDYHSLVRVNRHTSYESATDCVSRKITGKYTRACIKQIDCGGRRKLNSWEKINNIFFVFSFSFYSLRQFFVFVYSFINAAIFYFFLSHLESVSFVLCVQFHL